MNKYMVIRKADLQNIEILPTKFDRKVGDKINSLPIVAILNSDAEKRAFIQAWNRHVGRINYQQRKLNRLQAAQFWAKLAKENPTIADCLNTLAQYANK